MTLSHPERRVYRRYRLGSCGALRFEPGKATEAHCVNVSRGGALLAAPPDAVPPCGANVELEFSLPRKTPNTYMVESVKAPAEVVRHQLMKDNSVVGVAVRFTAMLDTEPH